MYGTHGSPICKSINHPCLQLKRLKTVLEHQRTVRTLVVAAASATIFATARTTSSGHFDEHPSVTVLPITSTLVEAPLLRITVQPSPRNGLQGASQVMIDKALNVKREKLGTAFGHIEPGTLIEVERCLAVFLGIAK